MRIEIDLPLPPTANNAYVSDKRTGRRYLSQRARLWKDEAGWLALIGKSETQVIKGPYTFVIRIPEKARGDTDGYIKLAQDLLVSIGITPDDRVAKMSQSIRDPDIRPRRCLVIVEDESHDPRSNSVPRDGTSAPAKTDPR